MVTPVASAHSAARDARGRAPRWLRAVFVAALACLGAAPRGLARPPDLQHATDASRKQLHAQLKKHLDEGRWQREDGHTYAIDVAQLMTYAAIRGDRELYDALRSEARLFLLEKNVAEGKRTFVAWRFSARDPTGSRDASGTTEALELARALWQGAATFPAHRSDRDTALDILAGYGVHARVSSGVWMIRNYYNFGTKAFADDSYLVDYAPDFLARVAQQSDRRELCQLASRSAALLRDARSPAGLYHAVVSPGLKTLMPFAIHSPNGLEALSNVVAVAERSVSTNRPQAETVLRFVSNRMQDLRLYYDARTGEPRRQARAGAVTFASLVRLAILLDDVDVWRALLPTLLSKLDSLPSPQLYSLGQALWALELSLGHMRAEPLPESHRGGPTNCGP